jgi:DNA polymerase III alpha subunit
MIIRVLAIAVVALAVASPARAADPRYPNWPCAQAKVPDISLAAVWAGPELGDAEIKWKDDTKVTALVSKLSARKTPMDEAEKSVKEFLAGSATDKTANAKLLFAGLFDTLNAQRSQVMNGLERVSRKQREAADKIREDSIQLQALQGSASRDDTKVEALSNELIWKTRIFEDRNKVVRFVCEVPTAIDQRLFALGRVIQQEME